ncbi:MAG: hypothetical protein HY898_09245 [Deltaproteobacteria bacterium]|nr:hypothetical protein [Deltaproteobacteria bacterium]
MTGAACPAGCDIVVGTPYDRDGDCYLKGEVVACHHGTSAGTAETCRLKVETDTLYWFGTTLAPLEPDVPGWVECSEADSAKVVMAKGWCE